MGVELGIRGAFGRVPTFGRRRNVNVCFWVSCCLAASSSWSLGVPLGFFSRVGFKRAK